MSESYPDAMVIQASGFGRSLTARQSIENAKKVLLDFERISPWRRPFMVNGCTEETDDMPIAEDLSNFEEVLMHALQSYDDVRYFNDNDPDNWKLTPDSRSPYGFSLTFSDIHHDKDAWKSIPFSIQAAGFRDGISRENSVYVIRIPFYGKGEKNSNWSDPTIVFRIFNYFIDTFDPMKCVVFGNRQARELSRESNSHLPKYIIGWLNYTRDPKIMEVFNDIGKAIPYRSGVLLKLGDDASALSDPKVDAELAEIGEMLRSAGVSH
ncbi:hypothetical protein [Methylocystis bryophila]|uniref:Immunity protein 52 domain-containing protein n=1 Tax=Methylocystis bryophila TaxID=655015 RepID=A0A1W6MX72_9HYPH|nr:hypothetical protein [Methylocystis bryophila]ARN82184.1 hypothetical protein B1812_15045 [Methylocystis bryophila]BDV38316.1 hypothetical protein DSM21852_15690 [Methylocystis bryophila]